MFNFSDVHIFWINCSNNQKRFSHMTDILEKYFPNNVKHHIEAIMHKPKYNGVTIAHTVALMKGLTLKKPFIILEDDVNIENINIEELEDYINRYEGIKAVYLGVSAWGGNKNKKIVNSLLNTNEKVIQINDKLFFFKGARGEVVNNYFYRVKDMYGAHSILYLDENYINKTLQICILGINQNKPHDIYLPKLLKKEKVFGLMNNWFYQLAKIGGQERTTHINMKNIRKISI